MMKFKLAAIAGVFVSLVVLGTGCSKNDEKLAYLKEKEKLLTQELEARQQAVIAQPVAATVEQQPVVVSNAPPPATLQ